MTKKLTKGKRKRLIQITREASYVQTESISQAMRVNKLVRELGTRRMSYSL